MYGRNDVKFEELLGKKLKAVEGKVGDESINFVTTDGEEYLLYHEQDCCDSVRVEDITGDLKDLLGAKIIQAEEVVNGTELGQTGPKPEYQDDSFTWTFYKLATRKGYVTIRWYGDSNGYYSESVYFAKTKEAD